MKIDAGFEGPINQVHPWAEKIQDSQKFEGAWVSDTNNDPFLLCSALVGSAPKLTVGTNIAVAFARSPYCVAQTAYNLAHLSQGRFVLGLGTQVRAHITRRFSAQWPERPITAMKEYVALLRHLFDCFKDGSRPKFKGTYFSCSLISPVFTPTAHDFELPRIGFAAVGKTTTKAAGEVAEAVFLHPFTHLKYLDDVSLPALEEGKANRLPGLRELEVVGSTFCLALDSPTFAKDQQEVLGRLAFYASTPNYEAVVSSLGYDGLHEELHQMSKKGEWAKMARALPEEFVKACVVIAEKKDMETALQGRFAGHYDRVVVDARALI